MSPVVKHTFKPFQRLLFNDLGKRDGGRIRQPFREFSLTEQESFLEELQLAVRGTNDQNCNDLLTIYSLHYSLFPLKYGPFVTRD